MANTKTTRYRFLRIYITAAILYSLLVLPFIGFLILQNLPSLVEDSGAIKIGLNDKKDTIVADDNLVPIPMDSIEESKIMLGEVIANTADSLLTKTNSEIEEDKKTKDEGFVIGEGNLGKFFNYYYKSFFWVLLIGILLNWPFKIYLRRKRKGLEISENIRDYCKKYLFHTPLINAGLFIIPHLISHGFAIWVLKSHEDVWLHEEKRFFLNFFYVSIVASFLTTLFVFYWQKSQVHLKYIAHFFSAKELRKRIFPYKRGNMGAQFSMASAITTFFPLAIVVLYFILSLTMVKELGLGELTEGQRRILMGNWNDSIESIFTGGGHISLGNFFYVSALDSVMMIVGMSTGILVSLFYIFQITRWTTRSVVNPVNELLHNMQQVKTEGEVDYSIVRSNDEVGELAEGFNIMISKIKNYVQGIRQLNEELEGKVVERTQKIERQKEEIEVQLNKTIEQKNTIEGQQRQIIDSIHYAQRIQKAILPPIDALKEVLMDYFVLYQPRDIVSGDFYWTAQKDDKIYVAVADCTGHGVPGAFLSILGNSYLNEIVTKEEHHSAGEILNQLRDSIIASLHQKGDEGEAQDGMEIALVILDKSLTSLQFAGANRPLYLVREAGASDMPNCMMLQVKNEKNELFRVNADTMPIGIYNETNVPFNSFDIPLQKGDSLYMFTDGYVDQFGGPRRKTFRVKYFRELLMKIQSKSMAQQKQDLEEKILQWKGELEQTDDMLVFGMRV